MNDEQYDDSVKCFAIMDADKQIEEEYRQRIRYEMRAKLKLEAEQVVAYVALGRVLPEEYAKKYGMSIKQAKAELSVVASQLMADIRKL